MFPAITLMVQAVSRPDPPTPTRSLVTPIRLGVARPVLGSNPTTVVSSMVNRACASDTLEPSEACGWAMKRTGGTPPLVLVRHHDDERIGKARRHEPSLAPANYGKPGIRHLYWHAGLEPGGASRLNDALSRADRDYLPVRVHRRNRRQEG